MRVAWNDYSKKVRDVENYTISMNLPFFIVREKAFVKRHPELVERYKKILRLLELNPSHPSLKLHKLKGRFSDKHAVSITYAYRIVITLIVADNELIFIDIGHHGEVY